MKKIIITSIGTVVFAMALFFNASLDNSKLNNKDFNLGSLITIAYAQQSEGGYSSFDDLSSISISDLMNLTPEELEHLNNSLDTFAEIQFQAARPSGEWFSVGVPTIVNHNDEGMDLSGSNSQEVGATLASSKLASLNAAIESNFRYKSGTTSTYKSWDCIGFSGDC